MGKNGVVGIFLHVSCVGAGVLWVGAGVFWVARVRVLVRLVLRGNARFHDICNHVFSQTDQQKINFQFLEFLFL